ncbi:MAG: hypothetical protein AAGI68_08785 [Planctomycetota bacterium]
MPTPILVHVGFHKTATTWLQDYVFNQQGFGYVSPWGSQAGLAVDLFVSGNPFRDLSPARPAFDEGMADASRQSLVPVLSNEAMCGSQDPRKRYERQIADRLHEVLPEAKVLITIREQLGIILSHYREAIDFGETFTVPSYLTSPSSKPGFAPVCQIDHFEYDLFVKHYMELFGADRVLVLPMESLRADRQAFCDTLSDFSGVPRHPAPEAGSARVGWRGVSLSYKRRCNLIGIGRRGRGSRSLGNRIVNKAGRTLGNLAPKAWNQRVEDRMKAVFQDKIGHHFAQSNQRLQQLTGLDLASLGYDLPA